MKLNKPKIQQTIEVPRLFGSSHLDVLSDSSFVINNYTTNSLLTHFDPKNNIIKEHYEYPLHEDNLSPEEPDGAISCFSSIPTWIKS